jgi:UPF0755 protein
VIDDRDRVLDERPDHDAPRHRRPGESLRAVATVLVAVVVLAAFGTGIYFLRARFDVPDYEGAGTGAVRVEIGSGATLTQMGNVLVDAGVVKSTRAFTDAARADPRGQTIQSGTFTMRRQMSGSAAVALLLDPKARLTRRITIPEGKTAKQVYAILAKATGVPLADFTKAGKDPVALGVAKSWFERDDAQRAAKSIEGFLFPDTYEFKPGATAVQMLKEMVRRFLAVAAKVDFSNRVREDRGISPYEALIVASLAQAEAGNADDLGKIARVAYNRVYGDFPCHCLEFDVGINYYYQLTGRPTKPSKKMTRAELYDPKNPYRLHGKPGLTPTPINNPGEAALKGAMDPPAGPWLFFVAIDKQGHSAFATTTAQHEKNKELARKNGVL